MIPLQWSPPGHEIYLMAKTKQTKGKNGAGKEKPGDRITSKMEARRQIVSNPAIAMYRGPTNTIRVRNQEALNVALVGGSTSPYTQRNFFRVAPSASDTGLSWLTAIADQYSMYRFHSITVKYVPTTGTTQSGYVAMGFFPDAEEVTNGWVPNTGTGTLSQLSQCRKFTQVPLYSEASIKLDPKDFVLDWYYVDPVSTSSSESRLTVAGAVGIMVTTNSTLTNSSVGVLYLEYDVELKFPVTTNPNIV